jgi:Domain of unknown function (DUF4062)
MAETDLIRTPDQRVRVFVSSTLQELAAERRAVREAVTRLRLVPVMFELGARAHPPRPVYRACLAQSQIFVGIYWQSYGQLARKGYRIMLIHSPSVQPRLPPHVRRAAQPPRGHPPRTQTAALRA